MSTTKILLQADTKDIRRAIALVIGESYTDEEIAKLFNDSIDVGILKEQSFELTTALVCLAIASREERKDNAIEAT